MTDTKHRERLFTLTFILMMVVTFCGSITANGVHNGVAILVENAGEPSTVTGIIICCFALTALASRLVVGNLSDKHGRKIIIAAGALISLAGCILALFTTSIYSLIPSRILMGLGFSAIITVGSAAAADIIPASRLGEGMGYQSMAYAVAMALGPMIAIWFATQGRTELFVAFAVVALAAFASILPCKLPKVPRAQRSDDAQGSKLADTETAGAETAGTKVANAEAASNEATEAEAASANATSAEPRGIFRYIEKASVRPAIITVLVYIPMSLYMSYISLYAATAQVEGINAFFIVAAVVMVVLRMVAGKAFDTLSFNTLMIPGLIIGGLGFALLMIFNNTPALLASGVCYGIFCGIAQPLLLSESIRRAPDHRRGAASATFYIGNDAGFASGAFIWGNVISAFGFTFTFAANLVIIAATIVASLILLNDKPARTNGASPRPDDAPAAPNNEPTSFTGKE
ncbi:MAG: MFS transporter [Eggerthellales bacterium]|nr:MFS transporter [Eggerthellales bacterium]